MAEDVVAVPQLLERVQALWPDQAGPGFVEKQVAICLLEKGQRQGFQLRLHVLGHLLNARLGRDWRQQHGLANTAMSQFFRNSPFFEVLPTDLPNVDALKLKTAVLQAPAAAAAAAAAAPSAKVRVVPRPAPLYSSSSSSPKLPGPATPTPPAGSAPRNSRASPKAAPVAATAGSSSEVAAGSRSSRLSPSKVLAAAIRSGSSSSSASTVHGNGSSSSNGCAALQSSSAGAAAGKAQGQACVKGAALLACVNSMRWHEKQELNMLRQCLAANMVRRACDEYGRVAANVLFVTLDVQEAVAVLERAWTGRHPNVPYPYKTLQEVLGQPPSDLLKVLHPVTEGGSMRVRLLLQKLQQHKNSTGSSSSGGSLVQQQAAAAGDGVRQEGARAPFAAGADGRSSNGHTAAVAAAASAGNVGQPLFAGPPVCSRCGELEHNRTTCRAAYCAECDAFGHTKGQCRDACKHCGWLGHSAESCVGWCKGCSLRGHHQSVCPFRRCISCGRSGHSAITCPAGAPSSSSNSQLHGRAAEGSDIQGSGSSSGIVAAAPPEGASSSKGISSTSSGSGSGREQQQALEAASISLLDPADAQGRDSLVEFLMQQGYEEYARLLFNRRSWSDKCAVLCRVSRADLAAIFKSQSNPTAFLDDVYFIWQASRSGTRMPCQLPAAGQAAFIAALRPEMQALLHSSWQSMKAWAVLEAAMASAAAKSNAAWGARERQCFAAATTRAWEACTAAESAAVAEAEGAEDARGDEAGSSSSSSSSSSRNAHRQGSAAADGCAAAVSSRGVGRAAAGGGDQEPAIALVPKQQLLRFIQTWQWDTDVDYNLMKRALATLLVNKAAAGGSEVPIQMRATQIHVAQAGDVFHKLWVNRHGQQQKSYKKMADVIGNDCFFTVTSYRHHPNSMVQLNIVELAAASAAAAAEAAAAAAAAAALEAAGDAADKSDSSPTAATAVAVDNAVAANAAAAAAADAEAIAAQAVAIAQGALLAVDLLGFINLMEWHADNQGLHLLRQKLAYQMVEQAHPGLAEATAAGEQVLAESKQAQYVMSPYAAGNALVSLWRELHPSEPRPYTTLPSAFEGDRYLHLRLMATGGYQLQLDIAQLLADCTATMRDLQREWGSLTAGEVAAMAAKAASAQAAAAAAAAAVVAELDAVIDGQQPEQQTVLSLHGATAVVEGGWGSQNGCHSPDSGGSLPLVTGLQLATQNGQYAGSMTGSPSAGGTAALAAELAGPLPAKTQLPNMSQLLQLLQCAPLEVCDQAAVLLVPHSVQSLLFGGQAPDSMQQQQLLGDGVEHCYAAHGVSVIKDLADVNKMLDHLLACPIMAVGIACSSTSSGSQQTALLQLLAPPVGVGSGGGALDAAVYVFEVQQHLLAHEALDSCSQAMSILLSILFEDPNVVKLTEDAMRVAGWMRQQFSINVQGVIGAQVLQELLAPAGLQHAQAADGLNQILSRHIHMYQKAVAQLASSNTVLQHCSDHCTQPTPAEFVVSAAASVRPLMSLVGSAIQLLPLAMMRRCLAAPL